MDFKDVLHNEFVRLLTKQQQQLETVEPDNLKRVQEGVIILKALLNYIHKKDGKDLRERYES